jgi:dTDP-4-amino-4,6-dideoxygalactose transaminase
MIVAYREALESLRENPCPRRTVIPPNRLEAGVWDHLITLANPQRKTALSILRNELRRMLAQEQVYLAPSARCAIAQILSLLPHREVVMPAFNCDVVKTAVEAAGKRIIYVDVAKGSVNATAAEFSAAAQPGRILLATHQFGVPTDIEAICALSKNRGCITIEDAACCFGATHHGQPLGTFGDFGVFSFESWKRLPAFQGGAISVNNDQIFDPSRLESEPLVETSMEMPSREVVSALIRNISTIPWLYGRLILPILMRAYFQPRTSGAEGGGGSVTDGAAFRRAIHPYQARLILRMFGRMDRIRAHISRLTAVYENAFRNSPVMTFLPSGVDNGGLLRYPIAFPGKTRAEVLRLALKRGIYLETEFEQPLPDPSSCGQFPNSVWTAANLVLLPLYSSLSMESAAWLANQALEIANEASESAQ